MQKYKSFEKWLTVFTGALNDPDQPILTVAPDPDALLECLYQAGYPPIRAAQKFNARIAKAIALESAGGIG